MDVGIVPTSLTKRNPMLERPPESTPSFHFLLAKHNLSLKQAPESTPGFEDHFNILTRLTSGKGASALRSISDIRHPAVRLWNTLQVQLQHRSILPTAPSLEQYLSLPFDNIKTPESSWFVPWRPLTGMITVVRHPTDTAHPTSSSDLMFDIELFTKTYRVPLRLSCLGN
jgi:hypothetical protein